MVPDLRDLGDLGELKKRETVCTEGPHAQPSDLEWGSNPSIVTGGFSPHLGEVARASLARVTELCGAAFLAEESILLYSMQGLDHQRDCWRRCHRYHCCPGHSASNPTPSPAQRKH